MTCEEALLLISGHIDNENTPEEEAQLHTHLEACPECRNVLLAFLEVDAGIADLQEEVPADLRETVMQAIRQEAPVKKKRSFRKWSGIAVAAALALVIGISVLPRFDAGIETTAAPMMARSMPEPSEDVMTYSVKSVPAEAFGDMVAQADVASAVVEVSPQALANERRADLAVNREMLPEMEVCSCETVEGGLLYCMETREGAVNLSRMYGVELYQPEEYGDKEVSYVLLIAEN